MSNTEIANLLDKLAGTLQEDGAAPERALAWRRASRAVRRLGLPVIELLRRGGIEAVAAIPGVGAGLAFMISAMVDTADDRAAMAS